VRRFLALLILLWAVDAQAAIIMNSGACRPDGGGYDIGSYQYYQYATCATPDAPEVPACSTQSTDVSLTVNNASSVFYSDDRGQSWKAGVSGDLYSITLMKAADFTANVLTIRIGVSSNLSATYMTEFTCNVPYASGAFECIIPEASRPTLAADTTYHFLAHRADIGAGWSIGRDSGGSYADGTSYYDTTDDWVGVAAASDLYFITKMCD